MLNDSVVLVCSENTLLPELFRGKRCFMLECSERKRIERFMRKNCKLKLSRNYGNNYIFLNFFVEL